MASNDKKAMDALLGDNLEQRLKPDAPKVKEGAMAGELGKQTAQNDHQQR